MHTQTKTFLGDNGQQYEVVVTSMGLESSDQHSNPDLTTHELCNHGQALQEELLQLLCGSTQYSSQRW